MSISTALNIIYETFADMTANVLVNCIRYALFGFAWGKQNLLYARYEAMLIPYTFKAYLLGVILYMRWSLTTLIISINSAKLCNTILALTYNEIIDL